MCTPITNIDYEHDCNQAIVTQKKEESLQYSHLFSLVSNQGMIKNLIVISDDILFTNQYVIIKGFFENEPERITRWYITRWKEDIKGEQEPVCYGDKIKLYSSNEMYQQWTYPRKIELSNEENELFYWQVCWNDGKLPPKVSSNFVIKKEKELGEKIKETTITVYRKDLGWMVAGSVLIALVVLLIIVLIVLSYYISRVWKIKLNDFIIKK